MFYGLTLMLLVVHLADAKIFRMTENLVRGYSFESILWELSNASQHDKD